MSFAMPGPWRLRLEIADATLFPPSRVAMAALGLAVAAEGAAIGFALRRRRSHGPSGPALDAPGSVSH